MASCLEFAKLVITTLLHQYWKNISVILRVYLTFAVCVLIFITSIGIYGFLSAAYQKTSISDKIADRKIELIDGKLSRYTSIKDEIENERKMIDKSIYDLRLSLGNTNHIQYVDKKTGQLVTSSSSSVRKSIENQLTDAINSREKQSDKFQSINDSITKLDLEKIEIQNESESSTELGPLKYISIVTNSSMDKVVNYFLLIIILVFDPLAVALILAANYTFSVRKTKDKLVSLETPIKMDDHIETDTVENQSHEDTESTDSTYLSKNQIRNMSGQAVKEFVKKVMGNSK